MENCEKCIFHDGCEKVRDGWGSDVCEDYVKDLSKTLYRNRNTGQIYTWIELSDKFEQNFTCFEAFYGWVNSDWEEL